MPEGDPEGANNLGWGSYFLGGSQGFDSRNMFRFFNSFGVVVFFTHGFDHGADEHFYFFAN